MGNTAGILTSMGFAEEAENDHIFEQFESENVTAPINEYSDMNADNFTYDRVLQNGSFGMVVEVTKKTTNEKFAMKIMSKQVVVASLGNDSWRACMEPHTFAACSHPFVSELFHAFQTETLLVLVSSLGTWSDLSVVLNNEGCLTFEHIVFYCAGVTSALSYLHSLKLILRNLKPAGVLINKDGYVKISDFSAATDMNGKFLEKCVSDCVIDPPVRPEGPDGTSASTPTILELTKSFRGRMASGRMSKTASLFGMPTQSTSSYESHTGIAFHDSGTVDELNLAISSNGYMAPELAAQFRSAAAQPPKTTKPSGAADWWALGALAYAMLGCAFPSALVPTEHSPCLSPGRRIRILCPGGSLDDLVGRMTATVGGPGPSRLVDFIRSLLITEPKLRLGYQDLDVANHILFNSIDWKMLQRLEISPPPLPEISVEAPEKAEYQSIEAMLIANHRDAWLKFVHSEEDAIQRQFVSWQYVSPSVVFSQAVDCSQMLDRML